jgi:hypothetical protein
MELTAGVWCCACGRSCRSMGMDGSRITHCWAAGVVQPENLSMAHCHGMSKAALLNEKHSRRSRLSSALPTDEPCGCTMLLSSSCVLGVLVLCWDVSLGCPGLGQRLGSGDARKPCPAGMRERKGEREEGEQRGEIGAPTCRDQHATHAP